jgi:hypothetical protein
MVPPVLLDEVVAYARNLDGLDELQPWLRVPIDQYLTGPVGGAVDNIQRIRADPLAAHDLDNRWAREPTHLGARRDLLQ